VHCQLERSEGKKEVWFRNYKKLNISEFKKNIMSVPDIISPTGNVDEAVNCYQNLLIDLLDKQCPLEYRKFKRRPNALWYTNELANLKRRRRKLERNYIKDKSLENSENYRKCKREYSWKLKEVRNLYYQKRLEDNKNDPKCLHKTINQLTGKKIDPIYPRHGESQQISENMSNFFIKKVEKIRDEIAIVKKNSDIPNMYHAVSNTPQLTAFRSFSEKELKDIISEMKTKSCSLDPIPTWLVKSCFEELKHILLYITDRSFSVDNTFPSLCKHATVTPVIKEVDGDTEDYSNYRPISNTLFISKMLEKIALEQINHHIQENNLHCMWQSGYRKYHSCETAMIKIISDIDEIVSNGDMVALILLDLSAAFDTVDHQVLVNRLQTDFGINGKALQWIRSYLHKRTFSVKIDNAHSNPKIMIFGVPQGSLLGPVLFILYTKEISTIALKHGLTVHMYADDTQLYLGFKQKSASDTKMKSDSIQSCLQEIKEWMSLNFLKINPGKTKFLIIGSKHNIRNDFGNGLVLLNESNGKEIEKLNKVLLLGVNVDSTISMEAFVNSKCSEVYYKLRNIGRIRSCLDIPMRIMLVRNLILSKLDYCNSILANIPEYMVHKLQKVLNASVRFIYDVPKYAHISSYVQKAHFLPIKQRIQYKLSLVIFKILHGIAPKYLNGMISLYKPNRNIRVGRDEFNIEQIGTNFVSEKMSNAWNQLPLCLRCNNNITAFKKELKTFYFKQAYSNT
jgi:hypothetical protein